MTAKKTTKPIKRTPAVSVGQRIDPSLLEQLDILAARLRRERGRRLPLRELYEEALRDLLEKYRALLKKT